LETVVATGLLLLGLAVIGAQVQDSYAALHEMRLRQEARHLAESQFGLLDLGLVELDSADEVQEEEFGPRYPDFAWRMTINETASEGLYLLMLEILHELHQDSEEYHEGDFDFDSADTVYTLYVMRPAPQQIDLGSEFGMNEEELEELSTKLAGLGIEGLSVEEFDPHALAKPPTEDLLDVLPVLLGALESFGVSLADIQAVLPPDALQALEESGLLEDGESGEGTAAEAGDKRDGGGP
jgi:hypothetical protein